MTIYFDYTAGRGNYDDDERCQCKVEQRVTVKDWAPSKKVIAHTISKVNPQKNSSNFNEQYKAKNANIHKRSDFYYSFEQESESKKETYGNSYQPRNQGIKKRFNKTQYYDQKPYSTFKPKSYGRRQVEITIGAKYQKTDIQD